MLKAKDLHDGRRRRPARFLEKTLTRDVFNNRFNNFPLTNRLDDTSPIRKSKKDLARSDRPHAKTAGVVIAVEPAANEEAPKAKKPAVASKAAKLAQQVEGQQAATPKKKSPAKKSEAK